MDACKEGGFCKVGVSGLRSSHGMNPVLMYSFIDMQIYFIVLTFLHAFQNKQKMCFLVYEGSQIIENSLIVFLMFSQIITIIFMIFVFFNNLVCYLLEIR